MPKFLHNHARAMTVAVLAVTLLAVPSTGHAQLGFIGVPQIVFDPSAVGKLATQLTRQIQQIGVARSHLQTQVDNMRKLGRYELRDVNRTMSQIDALTRQGQALSYSLSTIDREFQSTFSGSLPGGRMSTAMVGDIRRQNQRTLATAAATLSAAKETARQFAVATTQLNTMRSQLGSIRSAQQAAELSGMIGIHTAQELTLLRQQLAAQGNAQAVMMANQVNRDLQGTAAAQAFWRPGQSTPVQRKNMSVDAVGFRP